MINKLEILEELITVDELCDRIKYKKQTIYNLIYKNKFVLGLHFFKPSPKKILFRWTKIMDWLGEKPSISNLSKNNLEITERKGEKIEVNSNHVEKCKIII